jgi:CHAT domain-containing protein
MLGLFMKPIRGLDHPDVAEKRMAVADYRVVYCATHSLVARDVAGLAEPSLALTLPKQPTEPDDGLLTASEVAQLKLDADWVVLSTCNTAAADKPKAEALSGLARAFFYAGGGASRLALSVDSEAAARLTTSTFAILTPTESSVRPGSAPCDAVLHERQGSPLNSYPAFW